MRRALLILAALVVPVTGQRHPLADEYNRAWALAAGKTREEGVALIKALIEKQPEFELGYLGLLEVYEPHETQGLLEYFLDLTRRDSKNHAAWCAAGHVAHADRRGAEFVLNGLRANPESLFCLERASDLELVADPVRAVVLRTPASARSLYGRAVRLVSERRLEEAYRAAERGLALARESGDTDALAALHAIAACALSTGGRRSELALAHVQEVFRLAEASGLEHLRLFRLRSMSGAAQANGDREKAERFTRQLVRESQIAGNQLYVFLALRHSAFIKVQSGEWEEARDWYMRALRLAEEQGFPHYAAVVARDLGDVYRSLGDLDAARETLESSIRGFLAVGDHTGNPAFAEREIGSILHAQGDYFRAIEVMRHSRDLHARNNHAWAAGATTGMLGSVYRDLGDLDKAEELYRESLSSAARFLDREEQVNRLTQLGDLDLRRGRLESAQDRLERAVKLARTVQWQPRLVNALLKLGSLYRSQGLPAARATLEESLELARRLGLRVQETEALIELSGLARTRGNAVEPERLAREALSAAELTATPALIASARTELARALKSGGDLDRALSELEKAVAALESIRSLLPTPEMRAGLVHAQWGTYAEILDVLATLHSRDPAAGYDRRAFDYSKRMRSRAFLETLAEARAQLRRTLPAEVRAKQHVLERAISDAHAAVMKSPSAANRARLDKAETELSLWEGEVRAKYRALQSPRPLGEAEARQALPAGAALVSFALLDGRSLRWVLTRGAFRMDELASREEIEVQARLLRAALERHPKREAAGAWRTPAQRLGALLFKSLPAGLERLLIVPDGALHGVPFAALPAPGAPAKFAGEAMAVSYAPSASVAAELSAHLAGGAARDLLAYGDPDYGGARVASGVELVRGIYQRAGINFVQLPYAGAEVRAVGALYPPERRKVATGAEASEAALKRERLADYRVLHLAAHALADEGAPARSGVVLSLKSPGAEDGVLRVNEILNLELAADLVVLSACQTARGRYRRGEGVEGLARAFLHAGARSVAASLWSVNDRATADLMRRLHEGLRRGLDPARALQAAQLGLIRSGVPAYRHPYFWSGFVVLGRF
jgi:CHAT domain-containing protein